MDCRDPDSKTKVGTGESPAAHGLLAWHTFSEQVKTDPVSNKAEDRHLRLSSDFHVCAMACAHSHTHANTSQDGDGKMSEAVIEGLQLQRLLGQLSEAWC